MRRELRTPLLAVALSCKTKHNSKASLTSTPHASWHGAAPCINLTESTLRQVGLVTKTQKLCNCGGVWQCPSISSHLPGAVRRLPELSAHHLGILITPVNCTYARVGPTKADLYITTAIICIVSCQSHCSMRTFICSTCIKSQCIQVIYVHAYTVCSE